MAEPYGNEGPEGYDYDDGDREHRRRWIPRTLTTIAAVIAIGGFSGVLVYAYNKGKEVGRTSVPPIIKAGPAPHKIRPEKPGGMDIPDRDKGVYKRLAGTTPAASGVERLLPQPETPMNAPKTSEGETAPEPSPVVKAAREAAAGTSESLVSAKPIKLPPTPRVAEVPPRPPNEITERPRRVASASAVTGTRNDAGSALAPVARRLAKLAPATGGDYRIQMAALRSEAKVQKTWKNYKGRHGDLLGELSLIVERKKLGGGKGVYYRLQAGPLASRQAALTLCSKLKQRKLGCIIVRR